MLYCGYFFTTLIVLPVPLLIHGTRLLAGFCKKGEGLKVLLKSERSYTRGEGGQCLKVLT